MLSEELTRTIFAIIFFSIFSVGFYHRIRAHRQKDRFDRMKNEGAVTFLVLRIVGGILWIMALLFPVAPDWFAPVRFAATTEVQVTGIILAILAIPMGVSVFTSIGKNITDTVETRAGHQLVTTGIYRFIRHPLYTTGLMLFTGLGLLSANWLLLLLSAVVAVTLYLRTFTEERKLIEEFGAQYQRYREETGKFFPRIFSVKRNVSLRQFLLYVLFLPAMLPAQEFSKAIEDNSYYIEEAYNQEERVVQHIFNGIVPSTGGIMEFSFTQEWPAFGQLHQLSVTVPYSSLSAPAANGPGDIMLNYRYQLIRDGGWAVSPRLSVILPTGDETKGFGNGKTGIQFNLPVSKRWTNDIVTHGNAGIGITPGVAFGQSTATVSDYFAGVSGIYLASEHFNVMTEVLYTSSGSTLGRNEEVVVSPGVRWAHDVGDLQIVPGIAYPFLFTAAGQSNGIFLYLSFEHPY